MPKYRTYNIGEFEFRLVEIPGGVLRRDEHEFEISAFAIGECQVTQALWDKIMEENPSEFEGPSRPVNSLSWYDAIEFCNKLSEKCDLQPVYSIDKSKKDPNNKNTFDKVKWLVGADFTHNGFRLPTEIEWEYAARGGPLQSKKGYAGGELLKELGWYNELSNDEGSRPNGLKKPNALGLHDLSSNLWEWCWDWYVELPKPIPKYYRGPGKGDARVLRGGSWLIKKYLSLVSDRYNDLPYNGYINYGFRLAQGFTL
jgi:formylglycine-generating enzyme